MLKTESKQAVDTFFTTVDAELKRFIQARSAGERIARVTAPVNNRISAWRGEGTTLIPKRSASNSGERVAKISISQPLQPPQSTR